MKVNELKEMREKAPATGQLLAYTRENIVFESYSSPDEADEFLKDKEILELHLFDQKKEYRAISSMKRGKQNVIEYMADFPYEKNSVYKEEVYLEKTCLEKAGGNTTVTILNHISYGSTGMAAIDDYRMVLGGVSK